MVVLKVIVAVVVCVAFALAGFVYDAGWNSGRVLATLLGRDRLVAECLPGVRTALTERGFTPTDVEVGVPVSIGFASGGFATSRVLSGPFTFTDGPNGPRVDGRLACHVQGKEIRVDVDVDGRPMRAA